MAPILKRRLSLFSNKTLKLESKSKEKVIFSNVLNNFHSATISRRSLRLNLKCINVSNFY